MRIALILEHMDPSRGGREVYTDWVAAALAARGHDVTVICMSASWGREGVAVRELGRRGRVPSRYLRNFMSDVRAEIGSGRYDVTHAMLPVEGVDVYQPHAGTMPQRREASLRWRRGVFWLSAAITGRMNLYRRLLAGVERRVVADRRTVCLCVSGMVADQFRRFFGRTEGVRVAFNGVQVPAAGGEQRCAWRRRRREEIGAGASDVVVLCVASNLRLKGVPEAAAAFGLWQGQAGRGGGDRFVSVGLRTTRRERRRVVRWMDARQAVLVGPTADVFSWYAAADVCVLLSWYDSCSLTVLEALRWGVPAITTSYNGAAEVLSDGAGVVVATPADVQAAAEAMALLAEPARRREASRACRAKAEWLSVDRHVDDLLAVYAEVARGDGR